MGSAAGLAHAGAGFQERNFTGSQAAVMDEVLAQGTARPPAAEKRLVTVEPFLADLAVPGFNPQQHRLPCPSKISDTHRAEYSEAVGGNTRSLRQDWCRHQTPALAQTYNPRYHKNAHVNSLFAGEHVGGHDSHAQ
jgi:hypothetical protein